ncbi:hypothetical protein ASA1KI_05060 [Opitutales bacterium ASA1]|uniref:hypothetical protein n=1 Tax=Congregicoccus parvus TaxID=3081749 RepID=UPI002B2E9BB0|nr:hypothetical protein ASA1KI_05060 [Opitutales bacterium ASA1]
MIASLLLRFRIAVAACVFTPHLVIASASDPTPAEIDATAAFEVLKSLAGTWSGTVTEPETGPAATVVYRVTAGGSVVEERLFPDTAHEMVTMYHLDRGTLVATHYCAMGNQPRMKLSAGSTRKRLAFEFVSGGNMTSTNETHMHSGTIDVSEDGRLTAVWDVYKDGVSIGQNRFFLRRR